MIWNPWAECKRLQRECDDLDAECDAWCLSWECLYAALEQIAKAQRPGDAEHIAKKALDEAFRLVFEDK